MRVETHTGTAAGARLEPYVVIENDLPVTSIASLRLLDDQPIPAVLTDHLQHPEPREAGMCGHARQLLGILRKAVE